jgi:hypothetical protein
MKIAKGKMSRIRYNTQGKRAVLKAVVENISEILGNEEKAKISLPAPTEIGKAKYPPDGYYRYDGCFPCTCSEDCPLLGCKGECGCMACFMHYHDCLSA